MVEVRLRSGIADPEGATIESALPALGFGDLTGVRVGRAIRLVAEAPDEQGARSRVEEACRRLLANPVIEDATVSLRSLPAPRP
ncbi:MAG: phosphoribosylformylglycinamidine synthase subunit PurS [Acidimicrobiales bacterium]